MKKLTLPRVKEFTAKAENRDGRIFLLVEGVVETESESHIAELSVCLLPSHNPNRLNLELKFEQGIAHYPTDVAFRESVPYCPSIEDQKFSDVEIFFEEKSLIVMAIDYSHLTLDGITLH